MNFKRVILFIAAVMVAISACGGPNAAIYSYAPAPGPHASTEGPGSLNPAVTQATIHQTICVNGWTATVRPPESYTYKIKKEQLGGRSMKGWQLDHVIALELGGSPSDPRNLRVIPAVDNEKKGDMEDRLRREVCKGEITLALAQSEDHYQR